MSESERERKREIPDYQVYFVPRHALFKITADKTRRMPKSLLNTRRFFVYIATCTYFICSPVHWYVCVCVCGYVGICLLPNTPQTINKRLSLGGFYLKYTRDDRIQMRTTLRSCDDDCKHFVFQLHNNRHTLLDLKHFSTEARVSAHSFGG